MKEVCQRVISAELKVDGKLISKIGKGLVVFFGVGKGDTEEQTDWIVKRISALRVFEDENGKMNKSVKDVNGEILFVSQFTLFGDVSGGNRPSFTTAEEPQKAEAMYMYAYDKIKENGIPVRPGVFGADMKISQINDGPVTIIIEK